MSQMVDHVLALPEETKLMILAPVVANRKGEQLDLFTELRAQGFVRLRVDGTIYEIDNLPKLAKSQKHNIDVVVDRLKVREDMRQRLAESFETALRHADGRAIALEMESNQEHLFSAKFACPICSYALQELEPRLFSFNNPMGACPKCDGLGVIQFFDPKRVVAHPDLSLAAGAIRGWDKRNQFYFQMIGSLAEYYGFSVDTPFSELTDEVKQVLLYGSDKDLVPFQYMNERGKLVLKEHAFEGIIPNLERRYKETDSLAVREELAKYISNTTCPTCEGTRLRQEARHVKVGSKTLHEISHLPRPRPGTISRPSSSPATRPRWRRRSSRKSPPACSSSSTWAWTTFPWTAPPRPFPAAKPSASAWPARSAPASPASCTCWTSPPSACTSATMTVCCRPCASCGTSATR